MVIVWTRWAIRALLSVALSLTMLGAVSLVSDVVGAPRAARPKTITSPPRPVTNQAEYRKTAHRLKIRKPHSAKTPKRRFPERGKPPRPALGDGDAGTDLGISTTAGTAAGYYAAHAASPDLELGPVQAPAFLYAPTGMNANSCLEWTTAYTRYPGDTQTEREVWVWDHCIDQNIGTSLPMDSTFISDYLTYYNGANVIWVTLMQSAVPDGATSVTYDAMIYNFNTYSWDLAYEAITPLLPDTSGGWSAHENDMQQANVCPSLPPIVADQIQVLMRGAWTYASSSNSRAWATGWCFTTANAYRLQMLAPNYKWQVTTR